MGSQGVLVGCLGIARLFEVIARWLSRLSSVQCCIHMVCMSITALMCVRVLVCALFIPVG